VFTGDPAGTDVFASAGDEVGLYDGTRILDFIGWNAGAAGSRPGTTHNDAVAAGQ
jgi:hypothetical protein